MIFSSDNTSPYIIMQSLSHQYASFVQRILKILAFSKVDEIEWRKQQFSVDDFFNALSFKIFQQLAQSIESLVFLWVELVCVRRIKKNQNLKQSLCLFFMGWYFSRVFGPPMMWHFHATLKQERTFLMGQICRTWLLLCSRARVMHLMLDLRVMKLKIESYF